MNGKESRLKRPINPMPADVKNALEGRGLIDVYRERPPYQQNDYIGWIVQARREETRRNRVEQMLDELERGDTYMKMAYTPGKKQPAPQATKTLSIDDYLKTVPERDRAALEKLRKTIKAAAPDAVETISYRIPTFKYKGRPPVGFAAFKNHLSFMPMSSEVIKTFKDELKANETTKGTIHFTAEKPLSAALVKKLVRARIKENKAIE